MQPHDPARASRSHRGPRLPSPPVLSTRLPLPDRATPSYLLTSPPGLDPGQASSFFGPTGKVGMSLQPKPHQEDFQPPPGLGGQRGWRSPQENRPILQMRKLRPRQVRACLGSLGVAAQWGEENSSLHQPHQVVSRACQALQRLWGGYHPRGHHGCTQMPSACMAPTAGQ